MDKNIFIIQTINGLGPMVGHAMLALWPWGSHKSMEINMDVVRTMDLKSTSYGEAAQEIRNYIGDHTFTGKLTVFDDPQSFLAFDQGEFLAIAVDEPNPEGGLGFIKDFVR